MREKVMRELKNERGDSTDESGSDGAESEIKMK